MSPIFNFKSTKLLDNEDIENLKRSLSLIPTIKVEPIKIIEKKLSLLEELIKKLNSIKNKSNNSIKTSTTLKSTTTSSSTTTIDPTTTKNKHFEYSFLKSITTSPGSTRNNSDIEYQSILRFLASPAKLILGPKEKSNLKLYESNENELEIEIQKYSKKITFDNLCGKESKIDAITRTEFGNSFVFKGNLIWHIKGLTNWRLVDYNGWPKNIIHIFSDLPDNIDSAYFSQNHYYFTKVIINFYFNYIFCLEIT